MPDLCQNIVERESLQTGRRHVGGNEGNVEEVIGGLLPTLDAIDADDGRNRLVADQNAIPSLLRLTDKGTDTRFGGVAIEIRSDVSTRAIAAPFVSTESPL